MWENPPKKCSFIGTHTQPRTQHRHYAWWLATDGMENQQGSKIHQIPAGWQLQKLPKQQTVITHANTEKSVSANTLPKK